jgi:type VI secretion system protein ImpA
LRRAAPQGKDEKEDAFKKRVEEADRQRLAFDSAVDVSPITFYQTLLADIDVLKGEIETLGGLLDQRLQDQSPNWTELRKSIDEIRVFVYDVLKRRGGLPEVVKPAETAEATMSSNGDSGSSAPSTGPIRSRAQAIARLGEAAQYFSQAEPHSPVAYLVRRAMRWADMDFAEVLSELVKDDNLVRQIGETLGIPPGPESS